jgi:hypothetical protein
MVHPLCLYHGAHTPFYFIAVTTASCASGDEHGAARETIETALGVARDTITRTLTLARAAGVYVSKCLCVCACVCVFIAVHICACARAGE